MARDVLARVEGFCAVYGLRLPVLLAPMASACPPALSVAVANAGGMGACGALLMQPASIRAWATEMRGASNGGFQMNLWIPDPAPMRDATAEALVRVFLAGFGPAVAAAAGDVTPPDFAAQCDAMLEVGPAVISSIMGVYPADFVARMKARGVRWFATVTTVAEALAAEAAEAAGADAVVAQGMEAGGHRGAFDAARAELAMVGLFSLVPAVVDAVRVPVIATGGIADGRGVAAALLLGASAVQVGTGFLRCPEAGISPAWAAGIGAMRPEGTVVTRAYSGRAGRSLATRYAVAASSGPVPAPYPVQRGLTAAMRDAAVKAGDLDRMQAWAGQSGGFARSVPAGEVAAELWAEARGLLA